jgi:hypothetical protein
MLSYTHRVKYLTVSEPPEYPATERLAIPQLYSASLLRGGCFTPSSLLATPTLRELQVDLGPVMRTEAAGARCRSLATTLMQMKATPGFHLEKLRIRGWMSLIFADALSTLDSLHSLVLSTGNSLSARTLASFSTFPNLQRLSLHASHVNAEDFTAALPPTASFVALRTLRIRGSRSLIHAVLALIPRGTLQSLYIEAEDFDHDPWAWKSTFDLINSRAKDTLIDLTIDQVLEAAETANVITPRISPTLDILQPLRGLAALRRFTIDVMIPLDMEDRNIDDMASWWPNIEKLDLGTVGHDTEPAQPKITLTALRTLARCQNLRSLTLPLDVSAPCKPTTEEKMISQTALRTLLIGGLPPTNVDMPAFIRHVLAIFPRVEELECTSVDKSLHVDLSSKNAVDTLDEFANGQ